MAGMVRVRVDGLRQLDAALGELGSKALAKGVLRRVGLKALQPVADRMAALAPDDPASPPPDLHRSIAVGTKLTKRQAKMARREGKSFVEVYAGATEAVNAYAHIVEFGSVDTPPQPFARPAWESTKAGVLDSVSKDLGAEIDKTAKRAAKRAAKKAAGGK